MVMVMVRIFVNVNAEDMLQQNPDIILRTSHAMPEEVMKNFETEFAQNDIWSKFSAVQNGKVYNLDNNYFGMSANFNYQKAQKIQKEFYMELIKKQSANIYKSF